MVPTHNDDPYDNDEEEEDAAVSIPAPDGATATAGFRLPLKLTSNLTGQHHPNIAMMRTVFFLLSRDCTSSIRTAFC